MSHELGRRLLRRFEDCVDHENPSPRQVLAATAAVLGPRQQSEALKQLHAHFEGLGPLQEFVEDPDITDILVNGTDHVWVEGSAGLQQTDTRFTTPDELREFIARLVARVGRRIDASSPSVDAALPGGIRLHAVLPPIATGGPVLSLRISRHAGLGLPDLVATKMLPAALADRLAGLVRQDRLGVLICGGTGTGKTTVLGALLGAVSAHERIVCIEDTHEIRPAHPHVVNLVSREPNAENRGEVTLAHLVRQALRMRPDRLVLGEMRGDEIRQVFQAANTGHRGTLATVHANSLQALAGRLEFLALSAGLPAVTWQQAAAEAFQIAVMLQRVAGRRLVSAVGEISYTRAGLSVTEIWQPGAEVF